MKALRDIVRDGIRGVAVRLFCALLLALWILPSAQGTAPAAPSLTPVIGREAPAVVAKRPTVVIAELKSARPRKADVRGPDCPAFARASLGLRATAAALADADRSDQLAAAPLRTGKLARAPPRFIAA